MNNNKKEDKKMTIITTRYRIAIRKDNTQFETELEAVDKVEWTGDHRQLADLVRDIWAKKTSQKIRGLNISYKNQFEVDCSKYIFYAVKKQSRSKNYDAHLENMTDDKEWNWQEPDLEMVA